MGHLVSTLEFLKLLISCDDRLQIAVLVIKFSPTDAHTDSLASDSECLWVINRPESHFFLAPVIWVRSSMNALLES